MNDRVEKPSYLFLGVTLLSLSILVFEITLTKIFSVTLWYHFAYLIVSLSLFGIGAGGIFAFVLQSKVPREKGADALAWSGFLLGASILACLIVICNVDLKFWHKFHAGGVGSGVASLVLLYLICSIPFMIFGFAISLAMRVFSAAVSRIYAFDLAGSALGCLLFLVLIAHFTGPMVGAWAAGCAVGASLLLGRFDPGRPARGRLLAAALLAVAAAAFGFAGFFTVKHTKIYRERKDLLFEKWSALARITVYPEVFWRDHPDSPFGWGMSPAFTATRPIEQLWVEQDSSAGTPITRFDGDLGKVEHVKYDISAFPYHVKPYGDVFIVGSGGGKDVLTALAFGVPQIYACDINPTIVNLVRDRFRDFAGDLYRLPQVTVEIGDARNLIRSRPQKYDLIQMSLIDSYAATTAGAFALSENSLYTVEAFVDYLDHLTDDGVFACTRYLLLPCQTLKVESVARAALERLGVTDPSRHLVMVSTVAKPDEMVATIMVKKQPFTSEELSSIREAANRLKFVVAHDPDRREGGLYSEILTAKSLDAFTRAYELDIRPSTDDRPFFFQFAYFSSLIDLARGKKLAATPGHYVAVQAIALLIVLTAILTGLFYFLPIKLARKSGGVPPLWGLYFLLIGMGFMFVEIPFVQKGSLYLGHPTYGLSVALFSMLLFGGVGSWVSSRWQGRVAPLARLLALIAGALLLVTAAAEYIFPATLGWPLIGRVILTVAMLALVATPMGFALPLGMARLTAAKPNAIPLAWAINGAASVLGSVLAMAAAMTIGYRACFLLGALCYALVAAAVGLWGGQGESVEGAGTVGGSELK